MVACHLDRGICVCQICFSDFVCLLHRVGYLYIHELMYLTDMVIQSVRKERVHDREPLKSWAKYGCGRVADAIIDRDEFVSELGRDSRSLWSCRRPAIQEAST